MKSKKKNNLLLWALVLTSTILTSCNRGAGCPNSFSLKSFLDLIGF